MLVRGKVENETSIKNLELFISFYFKHNSSVNS